jgi:SAM-dependent methyltransferase
MMNQDQVFSESEADQWFLRNREALKADWDKDFVLRLLNLYGLQPRSAVEVGAANGYRVASIQERLGVEVAVAVEPSVAAVDDGRSRFPQVRFVTGTAASIDMDEQFDLVIVNGVLTWIDRATLFRSLAEVDRLVCDGGYLIVGDFLPAGKTRVRYHHRPEDQVFTYKQDYAAAFLSSGLYQPVAMLSAVYPTMQLMPSEPASERWATWLLRKSLQANYLERTLRT